MVIDNRTSAIDGVTNLLMLWAQEMVLTIAFFEAGSEKADLLCRDWFHELNFCCLLQAGSCSNSRVRNPGYNDEIEFIKEEMGLSMTINPELETAKDGGLINFHLL